MSTPDSNPKNLTGSFVSADAERAEQKAARISRREFGFDAAVAAALSVAVLPSELLAAPHGRHKNSPESAAGEQEKGGPQLTAEQSRDVDAKLANIIRKYGDRFSEEQRKHLRKILAYNETMLAPIRAFSLQNGDAPVTVLKLASEKNSQ